jgi:hypothetical protein
VQGNTSRSPPPPTTSSSSGGIELPRSPSALQEMYSRSRARRSSMVSTSSINSEASLDVELEFGMTACITLQVERMLQVSYLLPLTVMSCVSLQRVSFSLEGGHIAVPQRL